MVRAKVIYCLIGLVLLLSISCNSTKVIKMIEPTSTSLAIAPMDDHCGSTTITEGAESDTAISASEAKLGLIAKLGEKREQGSSDYGLAVFNPDGKKVAWASLMVRLWDVETQQLLHELPNPHGEKCYETNASFSSDGSLFAMSRSNCHDPDTYDPVKPGYLIVWDVASGEIVREMALEYAEMMDPVDNTLNYSIPVAGMEFIPDSHKIVYASGNTLEISDLDSNDQAIVIDLGNQMFGTQISFPTDGRFIYVYRRWELKRGWEHSWTVQHKTQIWRTSSQKLQRVINYPVDKYWGGIDFLLHGSSLIQINNDMATIQVVNLVNDLVRDFPYQRCLKAFSSDLNLMVCADVYGLNFNDLSLELWNTDTWREKYAVIPQNDERFSTNGLAFSPDGNLLAILRYDQLYLYDVNVLFSQ
jgi:WD40 repeat protein